MPAQIPRVELHGTYAHSLLPRPHGAFKALELSSEKQIEQSGLARVVEAEQNDIARLAFEADLLKKNSQP